MSVDYILETLTELGHSPIVFYDDNSHFAVYGDGSQTVSETGEICDIEFSTVVPKDYWKEKIRPALYYYLDR